MLRVKYLGHYSMVRGMRVEEISLDAPTTIRKLLEERLGDALDWDQTIVLVNGRPVSPDYKVKDGDVVSVMPFIGGG